MVIIDYIIIFGCILCNISGLQVLTLLFAAFLYQRICKSVRFFFRVDFLAQEFFKQRDVFCLRKCKNSKNIEIKMKNVNINFKHETKMTRDVPHSDTILISRHG